MPKNDVVLVIDNNSSSRSNVGQFIIGSTSGGSGGSGGADLAAYLRRDGTSAMLGNLDMGGYSVSNVSLLDGIDLPAHVGNPDAHHAKAHSYNSADDHIGLLLWEKIDFAHSDIRDILVRQHNYLQNIGPNDHHNQVHNIVGTDHTVTGIAFDVVGLTANNTLGLLTPSNNPLATQKLLRTDTNGLLIIKRLEGIDYVKSGAYLQAGTFVQAGTYVSAVTYVDTPLVQYSGNLSLQSGINVFLNPTGYVSVGVASGRPIRSPSFVSGFLGNGWQIDQNTSAPGTNAEFDNLTIRGRMRVYELLIQRIRATNGSIFVTSVGKAKTVTLVSGDTYTIECDEDHGFLEQDLIRAQQFTGNVPNPLYRCDMRVTAVTTLKIFTAVRENGSDLPKNGMDFVRIGNTSDATRRGGLYLSSDDSNAPFMDVFNGVDSWLAWTNTNKVKVRIGKITGITSTEEEYGIIAGKDGFGPTNTWIKASNIGVTFNNVPLRFFNGVAQTGYWSATGTEFWLGVNTGNKKLEWNGATLAVRGQITIEAGGNAATTTDVSTAQTTAINYTINNAANLALNNTTANWAGSNTRGGSANDVINIGGTAAGTIKEYATRASLGLSTAGRVVLAVQAPLLVGTPVIGLNLTSEYFGYYNGTYWTMFMKSDGTFRFGSTETNNRIEWNGGSLAGYNNVGTIQWYASANDGQIYAGGGNVIINAQGVTAGVYTNMSNAGLEVSRPSILYRNTAEPGGPLDIGTYPEPATSIDLWDTSYFISDYYGNFLSYTGQSILRLYSSSKHFVSDDTTFDSDTWYHYLDGVIEVPPMLKPQRGAVGRVDNYIPRMFLRNVYSSIVLFEVQRVDVNARNTFFRLLTSVYSNPQEQAYLRIAVDETQQQIISQHTLAITALNNNMSLIASNITFGNTSAIGTLNHYGVNQMHQYLRLKAWLGNGVYIEWFNRTSTPATRSAYMGYPDASTTALWISNELGSVIYLNATDRVITYQNMHVGAALFLSRQSVTPPAETNIVKIYQGGDGHVYLRGPNGYARLTGYTVLSGSFP